MVAKRAGTSLGRAVSRYSEAITGLHSRLLCRQCLNIDSLLCMMPTKDGSIVLLRYLLYFSDEPDFFFPLLYLKAWRSSDRTESVSNDCSSFSVGHSDTVTDAPRCDSLYSSTVVFLYTTPHIKPTRSWRHIQHLKSTLVHEEDLTMYDKTFLPSINYCIVAYIDGPYR